MHPRSFRFCLLLLLASPVGAQTPAAAPERPTSVYRQVIPRTTGENGYEELVVAGDVPRGSRRFQAAQGGGASLDAKRRVLRDPPVLRALDLLRRGLAKPVTSPRERVAADTVLPELADFRALARLLAIQQYVLLADGRVSEALESYRTGLRLARVVQTDNLISGLAGIAMGWIATRQMGAHLEQLSARDCEQLHRLCLEWLRAPDPASAIAAAEQAGLRQTLRDLQEGRLSLTGIFGAGEEGLNPDDDESARVRALTAEIGRLKTSTPMEYTALWAAVEKRLDERFQRVMEELRKPAWRRKFPADPVAEDLAGRVLSLFLPALEPVSHRYTTEQARVRLLACHAAILRHRWEQDELPARLEDLNLGELALDPFSGQPLRYERRGSRYLLTSVGAPAPEDDPLAVNGRVPISVAPGE